MHMSLKCLVVVSLVLGCNCFPDGAPIDVCVKSRPNQPNHGQARPQPLQTSPYRILQSEADYGPGTQITGIFTIYRVEYTTFPKVDQLKYFAFLYNFMRFEQ